jgi:hypothetical protein
MNGHLPRNDAHWHDAQWLKSTAGVIPHQALFTGVETCDDAHC